MIETVDPRTLSRGQREALQRGGESFDEVAEELAAETYGYRETPGDPEWFDVVDEENQTRAEVKSTSTRVGNKFPGSGRFRLWRSQTRSLLSSASNPGYSTWYIFVLLDDTEGLLKFRRMFPGTVATMVSERGGYNRSGHESQGRQYKLPWKEVF
jgi:phytoene dehydrogenase-like protein